MARAKLSAAKEREAKDAKAKEKAEKAAVKLREKEEKERLKAEKERLKADKERDKAEKERVKAQRDAELSAIKDQRLQLRLDAERKKLEAEREKAEREQRDGHQRQPRQQRQQEKSRQDTQMDRSRNLLSSFLGVAPVKPKAAAEATSDSPAAPPPPAPTSPLASATADPSTSSSPSPPPPPPSAPAPLFHPFQPKPHTVMAPVRRLPLPTPAELGYLDQLYHLPSAPPSPISPSSLSSPYLLPPLPPRRRAPFHWSRHRPHSRRPKLIQHHTSYRPPWYGYFPLSTRAILPHAPFRRDPALSYDVDSDEEWGHEPEGEELQSGEEGEEEGEAGGAGGGGRTRADGYEEDGDFLVPEDEDEGAGVEGAVRAVVTEKGGVKRVVVQPVVRGPYKEGDELTPEVQELLKWTWRLMDGPIDAVRKREKKEGEDDDGEKAARKRKQPPAAAASDGQDTRAKTTSPSKEGDTTRSDAAAAASSAVVATPQAKKMKRVIVPQTASSLPAPSTPAAAPAPSTPTAARSADVGAGWAGASFHSRRAARGAALAPCPFKRRGVADCSLISAQCEGEGGSGGELGRGLQSGGGRAGGPRGRRGSGG